MFLDKKKTVRKIWLNLGYNSRVTGPWSHLRGVKKTKTYDLENNDLENDELKNKDLENDDLGRRFLGRSFLENNNLENDDLENQFS